MINIVEMVKFTLCIKLQMVIIRLVCLVKKIYNLQIINKIFKINKFIIIIEYYSNACMYTM